MSTARHLGWIPMYLHSSTHVNQKSEGNESWRSVNDHDTTDTVLPKEEYSFIDGNENQAQRADSINISGTLVNTKKHSKLDCKLS